MVFKNLQHLCLKILVSLLLNFAG